MTRQVHTSLADAIGAAAITSEVYAQAYVVEMGPENDPEYHVTPDRPFYGTVLYTIFPRLVVAK